MIVSKLIITILTRPQHTWRGWLVPQNFSLHVRHPLVKRFLSGPFLWPANYTKTSELTFYWQTRGVYCHETCESWMLAGWLANQLVSLYIKPVGCAVPVCNSVIELYKCFWNDNFKIQKLFPPCCFKCCYQKVHHSLFEYINTPWYTSK